jgi:Fic family protein
MIWNWQQPDWPNFTWDAQRLRGAEQEFLLGGGVLIGAARHLGEDDRTLLVVNAMSADALTTSAIEGEVLDRASVQSSIRRQLGLSTNDRKVLPKEEGIAEVMVDLYRTSAVALSEDTLFKWHRQVMSGSRDSHRIGGYRMGLEPTQVVSGDLADPKVHFEAPPSALVPSEMARFLEWFNWTAPDGTNPLTAVTRAGIAHLYFESIHPFEDGNGRIGRAIAEKALAQTLGQSTLTCLAATILRRRKSYYAALEAASRNNEITDWIAWFAGAAIEAQRRTLANVEFLIDKTELFDRLQGQLNPRQQKALLRMFEEGPDGFEGGLSAGKYSSITSTSSATATRDLADLVAKDALSRVGEHKHARYHLSIPLRPVGRVMIGERGDVLEEPPHEQIISDHISLAPKGVLSA